MKAKKVVSVYPTADDLGPMNARPWSSADQAARSWAAPLEPAWSTTTAIDDSKAKITAYDLVDQLCSFHHRKKTLEGWGLVEGRGKRALVPPPR